MARVLDTDYLVVGAGAAGMAFTDALIDHADVRVALIDRRHGPGGHWLDAYPFVRLHQASAFYGVASTQLGSGELQTRGPEAGLHERADMAEVCSYFSRVLDRRLLASGKVEFFPNCEYLGDGKFVSRISGRRFEARRGCRVVDAHYVAPEIPATTPAPFAVGDGARAIPVAELARQAEPPARYVIVGSGKTATDACVWLLDAGVDPNAITWVRPREPWMLNRAVVQPDPAVFTGMAADILAAAATATSPDDLFLRLEDAGVMLRIDRATTPTMAKTPTLAAWELDRLRSIEDVVRLGHILRAERDRLVCADGERRIAPGSLIVHCAARGLPVPPRTPIWDAAAITVQPIRAGFPCFGAALAGYVEATRRDDAEKNRLCPPTPFSNTPADWCTMQVLGARAVAGFAAEPDIRAWGDRVLLNPARMPAEEASRPEVSAARERLARHASAGVKRLAELSTMG